VRHSDRPKVPTMRDYVVEFVNGGRLHITAEHRGAARYYGARQAIWRSPTQSLPMVKSARLVKV
jgi:hypothetical protein